MSDFKNKAYSAQQTALSTGLNGLTNTTLAISSAIDFSDGTHGRMRTIDGELYLATVDLSAQTNPSVPLWILKETSSGNYADGSSSVTPARAPDAIIPLRAFNGVQRVEFRARVTTPGNGKILVKNSTGATLNATGNTLKYYIFTDTVE